MGVNIELRENIPHGTNEYPYAQYYIHCCKRPFQYPIHWHDEVEIIFIENGLLRITISNQEYIGTAGDIFIVNSKELHFMSSPGKAISYYTILFPLEFISFQTEDSLEMEVMKPLRSGQLIIKNDISKLGLLRDFTNTLHGMIQINNSDGPRKQIKTRRLLLQLFELLIDFDCLIVSPLAGKNDMQREILIYIRQNYCSEISLQDLASHFYMSPKYISNYFKKNFGITFSQYVMHLRITYAKELLETTALPVTEVAFHSGFANVSYFIRSFKDRYSISPLQYRKQKLQ